MNSLKIQFENVYGIKRLNFNFLFEENSENRAFAIYAGNGIMKSSFARVFKDYSNGQSSRDLVFGRRPCKAVIEADGKKLDPAQIFVMQAIKDNQESEMSSSLLVNEKLRAEYGALLGSINLAKDIFLKGLRKVKAKKDDAEEVLTNAFSKDDKRFETAIRRLRDFIIDDDYAEYREFDYQLLFNDKVTKFLSDYVVKEHLVRYVKRYNLLLEQSEFFNREFVYHKGDQVIKQLHGNGYFSAKHGLVLRGKTDRIVNTHEEFRGILTRDMAAVLSDPELKDDFQKIDDLITKNGELKSLHSLLLKHPELVFQFLDLDLLEKKLIASQTSAILPLLETLLKEYESTEIRRSEIEKEAESERTLWDEVVEIFNTRFHLPYRVSAKGKKSHVLGKAGPVYLEIEYVDGDEVATVERSDLLNIVSKGEERAFYILNMIFEVEKRRKSRLQTLFIVDDIADSFDYRNKYAILQYLQDMVNTDGFRLIVLTHNFDFFRAFDSRVLSGKRKTLIAHKTEREVVLEVAKGIRNIFQLDWKQNFCTENRKFIGIIPFARNLVEYTRGSSDKDYLQLTSLLHWKASTIELKVSQVHEMLHNLFNQNCENQLGEEAFFDLITREAGGCLSATDGHKLENKVVLSIAIRLLAEKFMVGRLTSENIDVSGIEDNQTKELFKLYLAKFSKNDNAVQTLEGVLLMTPENIHLNSFMYEPILDMSDGHLRKLYIEVQTLQLG